jgi:hypothetical protein
VRGVEQRVFLLAVGRPAFLVLGAVGSVDAFVAWLTGAGRLRVGLRMLVFPGATEHDGVTAWGKVCGVLLVAVARAADFGLR